MNKPYIAGIAGGTCSGKSTLADKLAAVLSAKYKVAVLNLDKFYQFAAMRTVAPFTGVEYPEHNHPGAVDMDKMNEAFTAAVSDGENDVVLVEGIFALHFSHIRERFNLKIFVDLPSDERMFRRMKRMMNESTSMDDVANRYLDTVRYRHAEFVEPTRWHADVVVNGNLDGKLGADILAAHIAARLDKGI